MTATHNFPKSFGLLLYPQFEVLDVAGPIEALNCLARVKGFEDLSLSVISRSLDPVSPGSASPDAPGHSFVGKQFYLPTHTLDNAPQLDVLLVPGGIGSFDLPGKPADIADYVDFVRKTYQGYGDHAPLKHIISICNGAGILAKSGILDGHKATTNKDLWDAVAAMGPKTHWIAKARWMQSSNIWTTSGVSAGADGVLAWIQSLISAETVNNVVNQMEWIRAETFDNDPFATINDCKDILPKL